MNAPILRDKQEKSARTARNLLGRSSTHGAKRRRSPSSAWLAFVIGLVVDGTVDGVTSFAVAGAVGAVIVVLGFAADPMLADYYRAALMTKYTLLGVPLGWVFWRWGLPYTILCHSAANATHMALQWGVF